ncbi:helicase [Microbacterium fluvii]|uniref:Helicase n=1 Tax=Microbacterium fluvii TaxID=415215 RepID=A0ABW2HEC6_9MICO|nr:helicase [Microbacterium fluvii]MCU4671716.1 helicase [Microbacterium fluvii]
MAGGMLGLGACACAAGLALGLVGAGAAAAFGQRLAGVADAAALAAADAASGAATGVPCERAQQVAEAAGVTVRACDVDGLIATVTVGGVFLRMDASARARAGPALP